MNNRLTSAKAYAANGYPVFPLRAGAKQPAISHWPARATRDLAQITQWFADGDYNIGVVTGDKLVVLDFDDEVTCRQFVDVHFASLGTIIETRRGLHVYLYSNDPTIKNSACKNHFCDVRGRNGYVVGAGSTIDGFEYRFVPGHELVSVWKLPTLDPTWLPKPCPPQPQRTRPTTQVTPQVRRRAENYLATIRCVSGNGSQNTFYRAVCQLIDLFGLGEADLFELIADWNTSHCFQADGTTPYPWSEKEILHKIADALSR